MVVEDEALIALDLETRLTRLGYEVVGCADEFDEACRLAVATEPDLVLMDIRIHGPRDGIETAAAVREAIDVPVVFLTSHADDATIAATERASPHGYVLKPFDERTLVATIETALRRHAHDRQLRLLQSAVESATVGILLIQLADPSGPRIVSANDAFLTLARRDRAEVIGQLPCFLASENSSIGVQRLQAALEQGREEHAEIQAKRSDGSLFWSRVSLSPVFDRAGRTTHMLVFHEDISRLRWTEDNLSAMHTLELQSWAIAGFRHEFNNLLSVVSANASLLVEPDGDEFVRASVDDILLAARRGAALVEQLDDIGHPEPRLHASDAGQVLRAAQSVLRRVLGGAAKLRIEAPLDPVWTAIAPTHLQQVIVSLMLIERSKDLEFRRLIWRVSPDCVADPSPGAPQLTRIELLRQVVDADHDVAVGDSHFDPNLELLPRVGPTRLDFVRRLIERAGGSFVVSDSEPSDIVATILLPRALAMSAQEDEILPASLRGVVPGGICLLVQDDAALRRASARVLGEVGFDVRACVGPDAAAGVASRLEGEVTLVVLDATGLPVPVASVMARLRRLVACRHVLMVQGAAVPDSAGDDEDTMRIWKPYSSTTLARAAYSLVRPGVAPPEATEPELAPKVEPKAGQGGVIGLDARSAIPRRRSTATGLVSTRQRPLVLVVDDEDPVLRTMARVLRGAGLDVLPASGQRDALAKVEAMPQVEACVIDVGLSDGDGFELVALLRERYPRLPFVVVSGNESADQLRQALRMRAVAHLAKPLDLDSFVREVQDAVAEGELQRLHGELLSARLGHNADGFVPANSDLALSEALSSIRMAFQPIVRASDGGVVAYEALMRPQGASFRSPPALLGAAELLDRVEEVGRITRGLVAEALHNRPAMSADVYVNLHPLELRREVLLAPDEPLFPFADRIVFEVTERAQVENGAAVGETLDALRREGFRIAVDDLGEGYAGLSWLLKMRPDIVKLDMSLVRAIDRSLTQRRLVGSLVGFCRRSEIRVLAEGIETQAEAEVLVDLGCELLQGYHFGRPGFDFAVVDPRNGASL